MASTNHLLQLVHQRASRVRARAEALVWTVDAELAVAAGPVAPFARLAPPPADAALSPIRPGDFAAPAGWTHRWCRVEVPSGGPGRHLWWRCQGETTAWIDGEPWAGLDVAHPSCPLPGRACTVWLDHHLWATGLWAPGFEAIGAQGARFDGCHLRHRDETAARLVALLEAMLQVVNQQFADHHLAMPAGFGRCPPLEQVSPLLRRLLGGLDEACDAFDRAGCAPALAALSAVQAALPAEAWWPRIAAVGHSHIDLVYLWPEQVGEAKGVHTCATALRNLDADPAFRFTHSQPAQYRAIQRLAPGLFARIRERIREGRWEITGALECEADTHLPCGEALFRSLALGQRFIAELAGAPSTVCWLPDVFGYSACLPQLLRLAGVGHFFTAKLSWSAVTAFPYTTFRWRSPDGSAVTAQLCPINYNGTATVEDVVKAGRGHREAHLHPELLIPVGYGDGGGGPDDGLLRRVAALGSQAGAPPVAWSRADEAFRRLDAVADRLPEWQGELYLEGHRGTLTSQRRYKSAYRALERALQTHEAAHAAAGLGPIGDHAWQRLCFAQFHDALPGSSIPETFAALTPELEALAANATSAAAQALAGSDGACLFNRLPMPVATVAGSAAVRLGALEVATVAAARVEATPVEASPLRLANGRIEARFDAAGDLVSLSEDGGALPLAGAPRLSIAPDHPANYDAWDLDRHVLRLGEALPPAALEVESAGPHRAVLVGRQAIGGRSTLVRRWILNAQERHLRLELEVDWQDEHRCLRLEVPTAARGRWARYGCAFGAVSRSQIPGGPADEAQWEVPGSRWAAALADDGTGLALVAEATWGYGCRDGVLSATLLRSPTYPDPGCDRGQQRIRLAIGAYRAAFAAADVVPTAAAADTLFTPPLALAAGRARAPLMELSDCTSLVPAWVRPVEGGCELRAHEVAGGAGTLLVRGMAEGSPVDALGRCGPALERTDGGLAVPFTPYRIVSVRLSAPGR